MPSLAPLRVIIADDHALFREGLKSLLKLHPEVSVVGEVESAADVGPAIARTPCDLLLLDLQSCPTSTQRRAVEQPAVCDTARSAARFGRASNLRLHRLTPMVVLAPALLSRRERPSSMRPRGTQ